METPLDTTPQSVSNGPSSGQGWEPSGSGHAPSPAVLERLAHLDEFAQTELPGAKRSSLRWLLMSVGLLLVVGLIFGAIYYQSVVQDNLPTNLEFKPVTRGMIVHTITEKGELEAARNTEVVCKVRSSGRGNTVASTIKWVIDDGSRVKKGDLLMLLDDAGIVDQIKNQEIVVAGARDSKVQADSQLDIIKSENESALSTAQNNVELARLDLEKYLKGELEQKRKDVFGRITLKESEMLQSKDRMGWSTRMVKKGYLSESQARVDEFKLRSSEIELDKLREENRVLNEFDSRRNELDLRNKLEQAIVAEKVARITAVAKEAQAAAKLQAALAVLYQELSKLEDLREDLRNCRIYAPNEGMVVYYIPETSRFGTGSQQSTIAVGEPVKEGQKLMRIPDLRKMLVRVKIHESMVRRLKEDVMQRTGFTELLYGSQMTTIPSWAKLLRVELLPNLSEAWAEFDEEVAEYGSPAWIKLAAMEKPMLGHVKSVSPVASSTDWMSSDVKVYQTLVSIDGTSDMLKPGMSAEVTIKIDERDHVLRLPVQAVLESNGQRFCYVKQPDSKIVKRHISSGLNNNNFIEIMSDSEIKENELVLMNPRAYAEKMNDLQSVFADANEQLKGNELKGKGIRQSGNNGKGLGSANGDKEKSPGTLSNQTNSSKPMGTGPRRNNRNAAGGAGSGSGTNEDMQRQMTEFRNKMQQASPSERKKLINNLPVPDQVKERIREQMKSQGMQIDD